MGKDPLKDAEGPAEGCGRTRGRMRKDALENAKNQKNSLKHVFHKIVIFRASNSPAEKVEKISWL